MRTPGLAAALLSVTIGAGALAGEEPVLQLRATTAGARPVPLTIDLTRWSTDAERAPLLAALTPVPQAPPAAAAAPAAARGGGGGRGGRGGAATPPASPAARLATATKAAPTLGFIWGDGPTGYSIKYAWHAVSADGRQRIVLLTDRRLGAHASDAWPAASSDATADAEFTVLELRLDATGTGEGKTSQSLPVVDAAATTLAFGGYDAAPVLLKVTR